MTSLDFASAAAAGALSVVLLALPSYAQSLKEPAMTQVAVAPPTEKVEETVTTRRSVLIGVAVLAGAALWYLFRPDALLVDRKVNEAFPAMAEPSSMGGSAMAEGSELVSGRFHSNAHETKGIATIYRLDDGRRVLRLTNFATSNGPDVRVYLVAAKDVHDEAAAKQAGFVDLGELKGNIGDQNYNVPADVDVNKYRAVSIWCRRFSVNFGAAPLAEPAS